MTLTLLALLPILGALVLTFVKGPAARLIGMAFALATLVFGIVVAAMAWNGNTLAEDRLWIAAFGAHYALGLDGMGLAMVLLTVVLTPIVLLAQWDDLGRDTNTFVAGTQRGYVALTLLLEGLALYVFLATDVLLFYLFFEATLIPMYFLIARYGGPKRGVAALKFLLYSLAGGLVMLAGVIGLYAVSAQQASASYLISDLAQLDLSGTVGTWLFLAFFFAFMVKAPMVPFHTWLPDATEQAPSGSSVMLVGILDKIGTFGMIRFCLGLFPEASRWATPVVVVLAVISIIYGAIMAIGSTHLMRLIAFTSVSHFGFMVLGIFAWTTQSLNGSMFYMLNHGFSTAALFLVVGFLIHRRRAAGMYDFGGVQKVAPVLAGLTLVSGLSALGLPGMSSFVSEFMVLAGTWTRYPVYAAIATLGMVLAALYILIMYQRTMTGPVTEQTAEHITTDLSGREKLVLAPLIAVILFLGFYPKPMIDVLEPVAKATMQQAQVSDPEPQAGKAVK